MSKDEKLFKIFQSQYAFILKDKFLLEVSKNHFDKKHAFISFVLALLENRIGSKKLLNQLRVNKDEWSELFCELYKEQGIITLYQKLEINPIVPLEQTIGAFDCFNSFINHLVAFLKQHDINVNIDENKLKKLFKAVFGYLFYNCIDCAIGYRLQDVLLDREYDNKYVMILNNTKLFSLAKQSIVDNCQDKINNLIVLLLGMSNPLNLDK